VLAPAVEGVDNRAVALLRRSRAGLAVGAVVLCGLLLPLPASAGTRHAAIGTPSISRVIFGGKPTNPTITIRGTDLNYDPYQATPPRNPATTPSNQKLCPVEIKGTPGFDYGTRLYFVDRSAKPEWSAGRYRPKLGELDCIGLIVTRYTSGEVEFHFGGFFHQNHYRVNPGDFVGVAVNQTGTGVHVVYGVNGVAPGS
jgi:hypothetical protein